MAFIEPDIEALLQTLNGFEAGSPLQKFIGEAVFPNFKNIAPGAKVKFEYPLTALVGANGTGKSSILHALWGMPLRHSTARFWFSTAIDPIDDGGDFGVPRYFYKHWVNELKAFVETKKVRGKRRDDYWEPARALESDGMAPMPPPDQKSAPFRSRDRWNPTERPVKYINLKCEFSAFDRYFYYPYHNEKRSERLIRFQNGARRLKKVIARKLQTYSPGGKNAVFQNRLLSKSELEWISYVLGREYISAQYVLHDLYGRIESPSVLFERVGASYSEAFAGSGELAVVRVVMEVLAAQDFTLILLDEPETSLHPGAQIRLLAFLLQMIVSKKMQVVISTHSPTIVEKLPNKAIKVLEEDEKGRARVVSVTHPQVAFNRLGHSGGKKIVAVEDALLRSLLEIALEGLDQGEIDAIEIYVPPGGADAILVYTIPAWIDEGKDAFVILDGDKEPSKPIPDPNTLSKKDFDNGLNIINDLFKVKPMHISSENHARTAAYLKWTSDRLFYLGAVCPEYVLLEAINKSLTKSDMTNQQAKSALIKELNRLHKPTDAKALSVAARWQVPPSSPHIVALRVILRKIISMH